MPGFPLHEILFSILSVFSLNVLERDFGVSGTALKWFDSFLSDRKQRVLISGKASDDFNLNCGVPQGSCLGPVLFTLYVSRLFYISQHLPSAHGHADDTQLYFSFRPMSLESQVEVIKVLESCIAEVRSWFILNRLTINDIKTEFLIIGSVISWQRRQSILSSLVKLALNPRKVFEILDRGLMLKCVSMYI